MKALQLYGDGRLPMRHHLTHSLENDADIFQQLIFDLEQAVLRVDSIFAANGLSRAEHAFQDARVLNNASGGMYLEVIGNKIMPFDIHATSAAVWQHLARFIERMPYRSYYERQPKAMLGFVANDSSS